MNFKRVRNTVIAVVILALGLVLKSRLANMATKEEIVENTTPPRVLVHAVQPDTVHVPLTLYGKLNATERVDLLAEVSGVFQGGDRPFLEGTRFAKGEVLVQLNNAEAQANAMSLKGNFINALLGVLPDIKADFPEHFEAFEAYYNGLSLEGSLPALPAASDKLEKFLIARGLSSSFYQVKSAEERLAKFSIRAPFNGVVASALVKKGNLVSPGRALGTFVSDGDFELTSAVTLSYAEELRVGQPVEFTSPDVAGTWSGTIARMSPVVDAASQSVNVIAKVKDAELREGMYLTGKVEDVVVFDALEVPAYMVFDNKYVYTVVSDSLLNKTEIKVVEWFDNKIVIQGLEAGDLLVDAPTLKAASGTRVNAVRKN